MSIQIFQDPDCFNQQSAGKKAKLEEGNRHHSKAALSQKNKRVPLSSIGNTQGCRVQPSRAAKGKHKVSSNNVFQKPAPMSCQSKGQFQILEDKKESENPPLSVFDTLKESPMILSPYPECSTVAGIDDISSRLHGVFEIPEYIQDIQNYLKKAEKNYRPKLNYMRKQMDINESMRAILIDWLVEVSEEYKLQGQTLYLAVSYIDRFLSQMSVMRGKLQLVGAACMLVAAKFEEIYPPEVSEFVYITDDTYTSKQVLRMEHLILKTLSFDVSVPTSLDFLSRFLIAASAKKESQLKYISEYLCELSLVNVVITTKYVPSKIAASAIFIASFSLFATTWTPTMEFYTGYNLREIRSCIDEIHALYLSAADLPQQAVQQKYKLPKYGCVSTISPPQTLCL